MHRFGTTFSQSVYDVDFVQDNRVCTMFRVCLPPSLPLATLTPPWPPSPDLGHPPIPLTTLTPPWPPSHPLACQAYLQFLTSAARWSDAAAVLPRLLKDDTAAWERWIFTFAQVCVVSAHTVSHASQQLCTTPASQHHV
jgi:hypothetical protein